jgi:hypothetical protein
MSLSSSVKSSGKCLVRHMNKESWVMRSQALIKKLSLLVCMAHNSGYRVHIFPMNISLVRQMDSTTSTSPVYFRRSRAFEMKDPSDRVEASRLLPGALKYIRSGKARIATLQAVL